VVCVSDFVVKKQNTKSGEHSTGESAFEITASSETTMSASSGDANVGIYPREYEEFHFLISSHIVISTYRLFFMVYGLVYFIFCDI